MLTERTAWSMNGYIGIIVIIILIITAVVSFFNDHSGTGIIFIVIAIVLLAGITTVEPNEAVVLLLFGKYVGTIRQEGIVITIPFTSRKKLSLRVRHLTNERHFVSDKEDKQLSVSVILTYHIVDTAKALFYATKLEESVQRESDIILLSLMKKWQEHQNEKPFSFAQYETEIKKECEKEAKERFNVMGLTIIEMNLFFHLHE